MDGTKDRMSTVEICASTKETGYFINELWNEQARDKSSFK